MPTESKQARGSLANWGRPPFGYRLQSAQAPAGAGRLEPDPDSSPVVRRIFAEYLAGNGFQAIAARLTAEQVTRPSVHDRGRNPHHSGSAWSKSAVRAIIVNPRYAGSRGGADDGEQVPPLVPVEVIDGVQQLFSQRRTAAKPGRDQRHTFRGLLRCALCRRLMQGTWNNNALYYRCRVFRETADLDRSQHPANVYLAENRVLGPVQRWFSQAVSTPGVQLWIRALLESPARRPERLDALRLTQGLESLEPEAQAAVYRTLNTRLLYDSDRGVVQIRADLFPSVPTIEGVVALD